MADNLLITIADGTATMRTREKGGVHTQVFTPHVPEIKYRLASAGEINFSASAGVLWRVICGKPGGSDSKLTLYDGLDDTAEILGIFQPSGDAFQWDIGCSVDVGLFAKVEGADPEFLVLYDIL